jgi:hypothetical protein
MTVRTLLVENALMSFMAILLGCLKTKVSLDCLLTLRFERSGARMETATQVVYGINTAGWRRLSADWVRWPCGIRENRFMFA